MLGVAHAFARRSWRFAGGRPWKGRYRHLSAAETADFQARARELLAAGAFHPVEADARAGWERGWGEILDRIEAEGFTAERLTPQYFRHDTLRLQGRYIRVEEDDFEYQIYLAIRAVLFRHYLRDIPHIVELGCGTGMNLLLLHRLFPQVRLTGADWVPASQALVERIAAETGAELTAAHFDMLSLEGAEALSLTPESAVVTLHALEQLGGAFAPLLDHLLAARPRLCLHLEPIAEFYDPANSFDALALEYHKQRNYLSGFHDAMVALQEAGKIDLLAARRLHFGSPYHEAYSLIVWRPAAG